MEVIWAAPYGVGYVEPGGKRYPHRGGAPASANLSQLRRTPPRRPLVTTAFEGMDASRGCRLQTGNTLLIDTGAWSVLESAFRLNAL